LRRAIAGGAAGLPNGARRHIVGRMIFSRPMFFVSCLANVLLGSLLLRLAR
jgi:hypothetical protein